MKKATAAQFKLEIDVVAIVSLVVHPRFYNAFSSFCPGRNETFRAERETA